MNELPFSLELVRFLAEHRNPLLTPVVSALSFLGEIEGYVLVVALLYTAYDKRLAVRLSTLVLLAMMLNHVLKILVKNPRPFIAEGTHAQSWVASPRRIAELASEYSTPSGHAMAGAAFYARLYAAVKIRALKIFAVLAMLATGLSRPYLGVHYLEDVLLGWAIGLGFVWLAMRHAGSIETRWNALSHVQQIALAVAASFIVWLATLAIQGRSQLESPGTFLGYAGFLTGLWIGHPIELRAVRFDPRSASWPLKLLRYVVCVVLVIGTLAGLDALAELLASDESLVGQLARYLRYASAGAVAMLLAPWMFLKLRLADVETPRVTLVALDGGRARRAASAER